MLKLLLGLLLNIVLIVSNQSFSMEVEPIPGEENSDTDTINDDVLADNLFLRNLAISLNKEGIRLCLVGEHWKWQEIKTKEQKICSLRYFHIMNQIAQGLFSRHEVKELIFKAQIFFTQSDSKRKHLEELKLAMPIVLESWHMAIAAKPVKQSPSPSLLAFDEHLAPEKFSKLVSEWTYKPENKAQENEIMETELAQAPQTNKRKFEPEDDSEAQEEPLFKVRKFTQKE